MGVSQTLRRCAEGATYIRQGGHHVGHRIGPHSSLHWCSCQEMVLTSWFTLASRLQQILSCHFLRNTPCTTSVVKATSQPPASASPAAVSSKYTRLYAPAFLQHTCAAVVTTVATTAVTITTNSMLCTLFSSAQFPQQNQRLLQCFFVIFVTLRTAKRININISN